MRAAAGENWVVGTGGGVKRCFYRKTEDSRVEVTRVDKYADLRSTRPWMRPTKTVSVMVRRINHYFKSTTKT